MLRAPLWRGPGLPTATIALALLTVSSVPAPSFLTPSFAAPSFLDPPVTDGSAQRVVEPVGEQAGRPPASTTVVPAQVPQSPSVLVPPQPGEDLLPQSAPSAAGLPSVPVALLAAYRAAVAGAPAGCHLPVSLLAAIGQVESGSLAGRSVDRHHRAVPGVFGPVLSGGGYAAIHDSDGGSLDGDPSWDRAVGPMQFIPGTWRAFGRDGDGDGARDPQNVFDAAASAATYLCLGGRDLSDAADLQAAVLSYNHSTAYVDLVLSWQLRLAAGVAERANRVPAGSPSVPELSPAVLPMVIAAAPVPPPLVLVVRTPARPVPTPTGPSVAPSPHPAPRPPATPPAPAVDPPVVAARVVAAPVTAPPTEPAMMAVMTPIEVTLTPDPPVVTPTPDPPVVVTPTPDPPVVVTPTPQPPVVVAPTVVTPTVVTPTVDPPVVVNRTPDPPVVVTPTVVTPTVVTPTPDPPVVVTPTTSAPTSCPAAVPPSSQSVPPEPAVEAVGCVPAQPPATPSLPVDPPSPGGTVAPLATEPTTVPLPTG